MIVAQEQEVSVQTVRIWWNNLLASHIWLHVILFCVGTAADFIFNGHFITASGRWIIRVTGYIAETALLFGVLWLTSASIAPELLNLFLSDTVIKFLVWLAIICMGLMPEIIVINTMVNAIGHWYRAFKYQSDKWYLRAIFFAIAVLFTIPPILFWFLTFKTLQGIGENSGNIVKASAGMLDIRLIGGWIYGLLQAVYVGTKHFLPKHDASLDVQISTSNLHSVPQPLATPVQPAPQSVPQPQSVYPENVPASQDNLEENVSTDQDKNVPTEVYADPKDDASQDILEDKSVRNQVEQSVQKSVLDTDPTIENVHPFLVTNHDIYVPINYVKRTEKSVRSQEPSTPIARTKSVRSQDKSVRKEVQKSVRSQVEQSVPNSPDAALKRAYDEMVQKGMKVTGRSLGMYAVINKNVACKWFKVNIQDKIQNVVNA